MEKDELESKIISEDDQILVIDKPSGVPVQEDKTGHQDLLGMAATYCGQKLHLLNRLDRPVSGIVVMIKDDKYYKQASAQWQTVASKIYLAITEGKWGKKEGALTDLLKKGRNNKAIPHASGKQCRLEYRVLHEFDNYSLLKIKLITGRFHQIRAQLSLAGHPIKGDVKYGARRKNKDRSIHLHCYQVALGNRNFCAPIPEMDSLWQESAKIMAVKNKMN